MTEKENTSNTSQKKKMGRPKKYTTEAERIEAVRESKRNYAKNHYRDNSEEIGKIRAEKYKESRKNYQYKSHSKYARELGIPVEWAK